MNKSKAKEMFAPEKCPKCGKTTEVEHYDTGWRCVCNCGWYGVFHFDKDNNDLPESLKQSSSRYGNIPLSNYGYYKKARK